MAQQIIFKWYRAKFFGTLEENYSFRVSLSEKYNFLLPKRVCSKIPSSG